MKDIYSMDLHETTESHEYREEVTIVLTVLRVPGGWVYYYGSGRGVFVPYNNEFQGQL